MSKVDAMRALREARHTAAAKAAPSKAAPRPAAGPPAVASKRAPASKSAPRLDAAEPTSEPCGHRNMGGKSCTRDAGHSEKNHRYS